MPTDAHKHDPQFASTLASGIDILSCFRPGETVLGNKEFAQRTGLMPSTVARLTHTLLELGYLRRAAGTRKYSPGLGLLAIAHPLLASMRLRQVMRPLMQQLATSIEGAVSLVLRDRLDMVYVETARANERMQTHPDIGATLPMLSSAVGKAWLCQALPEQRTAILNQLQLRDPDTYAVHAPLLPAALDAFQRFGYCSNNRQWRTDTYGFAVPFNRPIDSNVFLVNCGVLASSGPFKDREREIAPQLLSLVRHAQTLLGLA